ncbi:MAG: recombination mediator RecR [Oscillospiraceae bacterium]|nr:recombination mediator RecR [Oscillospiraceae bacterium]
MAEYIPLPLVLAAEQFAKLPGIGIKTAQRLAYCLLTMSEKEVETFAKALLDARKSVRTCPVCQNFTGVPEEAARHSQKTTEETPNADEVSFPCRICADFRRQKEIICVVESPKDVTAFERAGAFSGVYHVLHGALSPMDGMGPESIRVKELMARLSGDIDEVIMATAPTIEGEATAAYISRMLKPMGLKITRLAYGLPVGASLEFADGVTLSHALDNRKTIDL